MLQTNNQQGIVAVGGKTVLLILLTRLYLLYLLQFIPLLYMGLYLRLGVENSWAEVKTEQHCVLATVGTTAACSDFLAVMFVSIKGGRSCCESPRDFNWLEWEYIIHVILSRAFLNPVWWFDGFIIDFVIYILIRWLDCMFSLPVIRRLYWIQYIWHSETTCNIPHVQ